MMNLQAFLRIFVVIFCLGAVSVAQGQQTIELVDGSRIRGEVLSMQGNEYTIDTEVLGIVKVHASRIASITNSVPEASSTPGVQPANPASSQLSTIQANLLNSSETLQRIMALQADPDMQAVLSDPEVMRAVQSLDFDALRTNPKIIKLMQNPEVRSITKP